MKKTKVNALKSFWGDLRKDEQEKLTIDLVGKTKTAFMRCSNIFRGHTAYNGEPTRLKGLNVVNKKTKEVFKINGLYIVDDEMFNKIKDLLG